MKVTQIVVKVLLVATPHLDLLVLPTSVPRIIRTTPAHLTTVLTVKLVFYTDFIVVKIASTQTVFSSKPGPSTTGVKQYAQKSDSLHFYISELI